MLTLRPNSKNTVVSSKNKNKKTQNKGKFIKNAGFSPTLAGDQ